MPTYYDETLEDRYSRENQDYLSILARMKPEQIQHMEIALNNALSDADRLKATLGQVRDLIGPYLYGGSNFREPAAQAIALITAAIQEDKP